MSSDPANAKYNPVQSLDRFCVKAVHRMREAAVPSSFAKAVRSIETNNHQRTRSHRDASPVGCSIL